VSKPRPPASVRQPALTTAPTRPTLTTEATLFYALLSSNNVDPILASGPLGATSAIIGTAPARGHPDRAAAPDALTRLESNSRADALARFACRAGDFTGVTAQTLPICRACRRPQNRARARLLTTGPGRARTRCASSRPRRPRHEAPHFGAPICRLRTLTPRRGKAGSKVSSKGTPRPIPNIGQSSWKFCLAARSPDGAGDFAGVTAPGRLAHYIDSFTLAIFSTFLESRAAEDRGSDAGRPPPPVRVTLRGQKPETGALTSGGTSPSVRGLPERLVGPGPRL